MNDSRNIVLALLCVSAAVLGTLVAVTWNDRAEATGVAAAGGEYIMFTGEVSASIDMLYVVDLTKRRMNAYHWDTRENVLSLKDQADLAKAFREPGK